MAFVPVHLDPAGFAPLRLAGAWEVTSDDPRFGGVSGLALDGRTFVALTDSGAVARFPHPSSGGRRALVDELPDGPSNPALKLNRDSEALLADPAGRGWWVAFENRNQLWLYDSSFARAQRRVDFGPGRWPRNFGLEGLAADGRDLLLFPEDGDSVIRWSGGEGQTVRIAPALGRVSEAVRLPGGGLAVIHRRLTLRGFANALTLLAPADDGSLSPVRSIRLSGLARDNLEALAAEVRPGGGTRLWLMSDDNFQRPLRTLLIALDLPKEVERRR